MQRQEKKPITPAELRQALRQAGLQPPRMLTLALTGACNLACSHCWVEAGPEGVRQDIPAAVLRRLLREFAALGGEGIRITGGEPLCHPAWLETLRLARELGFAQLALQTNATLLDSGAVAELAALDGPGLAIQVSLEGACASTHDAVRGAGSFAAAMAGLRRLVAAGLGGRIILAFTEMRHNLQEFPELLELAEGLGVAAVTAGTLVTGGRAAATATGTSAAATIDQYLQLVDRYRSDPPFRERYRKLGNLTALEWWRGAPPGTGCCRFVEQPYLTPSGRLYPCLMCHAEDFALSGVFEQNLTAALMEGASLWGRLQALCRLRPHTIAACQACTEQGVCAAGCPGRALGSCGDLQAPDDRCALRQALAAKCRAEKNR